ncbi:hypothetical protein V6N13_146899 [Hibiscus sabdariffa]|uniref:Uncharacterized protein n=1 Tax=Hibiscus sabdariffa TaxID=183260 RepID=A0ABR2TU38_9ROSI
MFPSHKGIASSCSPYGIGCGPISDLYLAEERPPATHHDFSFLLSLMQHPQGKAHGGKGMNTVCPIC